MDEIQNTTHSLLFEDYQNTLSKNITKFFSEGAFVNVTLLCDGEVIRAHQIVLSACSAYFENVLITCNEPHPKLVFTDISKDDMVLLLQYMYKGQVTVDKNHLPSLLKLAEKLEIRGLDYNQIRNVDINSEGGMQLNNTRENISPVLTEMLTQNETKQSAESPVHKDAPRWLTSVNDSVKGGGKGKKVINPFAKKSRTFSDSDSTVFDFDPCTPGPSKNSFQDESLVITSTPVKTDSDVEFIDNDLPVVVVLDTQSKVSPERHSKIQTHSEATKFNTHCAEVDFTSDESDLVSPSKKTRKNVVFDHSDEETKQLIKKPSHPNRTENEDSIHSNRDKSGVSIKNKRPNEPNQSKNKRTLKKSCGPVWQGGTSDMPFDNYTTTPLHKLRNFCVICKKFMSHIHEHIQKEHAMPLKERFVCRVCSESFALEKSLELHICQPKKKEKK